MYNTEEVLAILSDKIEARKTNKETDYLELLKQSRYEIERIEVNPYLPYKSFFNQVLNILVEKMENTK